MPSRVPGLSGDGVCLPCLTSIGIEAREGLLLSKGCVAWSAFGGIFFSSLPLVLRPED